MAWACGVGPLFPGFHNNVAGTPMPEGVKQLYYLCWPLGFTVSGLVLLVLSKIFPIAGVGEVDEFDVFGTKGEPETQPEVERLSVAAKDDDLGANVHVLPVQSAA